MPVLRATQGFNARTGLVAMRYIEQLKYTGFLRMKRIWFIRVICGLFGCVTSAVAITLAIRTQNPHWLWLLLLNIVWFLIYLDAEIKRDAKEKGVVLK